MTSFYKYNKIYAIRQLSLSTAKYKYFDRIHTLCRLTHDAHWKLQWLARLLWPSFAFNNTVIVLGMDITRCWKVMVNLKPYLMNSAVLLCEILWFSSSWINFVSQMTNWIEIWRLWGYLCKVSSCSSKHSCIIRVPWHYVGSSHLYWDTVSIWQDWLDQQRYLEVCCDILTAYPSDFRIT